MSAAEDVTLRKSQFGRTSLCINSPTTIFREIQCSASTSARHANTSIFHPHRGNNAAEKPPGCHCWHCCHPFEDPPFRLPRVYDTTNNLYHVYGWFCSANCAKAYLLEHCTFDRGYQMNIFVRMLRDVYGLHESVNEAPPRLALRIFGGPFGVEEFRRQTNICLLVTPPFISHSMLLEERRPIANIGECAHPGQRGSVRGLRRPAREARPTATAQEFGAPQKVEGAYSEYLREVAADAPSAVEQRAPKQARAAAGTGLAKFACK